MIELLLCLALLLLIIAIGLQLHATPFMSRVRAAARRWRPAAVPHGAPVAAAREVSIRGAQPGYLAVLSHRELLQVTGAQQLVQHLEQHARISGAAFRQDLLPAIHMFAEFVQLMPASESHHHANLGGLLAHALETTYHALVMRAGYLLPRNAGAETVDVQRDYWTYAIFFAALLHDVGKPLTDLRVAMLRGQAFQATRWMPQAGSLNECQAVQYKVDFAPKSERDYTAHGRLGAVLLQRLVPASALSFLAGCPEVMMELTRFLGNEGREGALAEIVSKADQLSTKNNLAGGSRARFATARQRPLVEQLMEAMQDMLQQGGMLPLNRDGAAGWVYDGSVWFVAKRVADAVREHILAREGDDAGIPGEAKNDRLFDCWQEYGQLAVNPQTRQAIWRVVVHGEDGQGYTHALNVLRFPLDKLWPAGPSTYPPQMVGRIEVITKGKSDGPESDEVTQPPVPKPVNNKGVAPCPASNEVPSPRLAVSAKPGTSGRSSEVSDDDRLPEDETAFAARRAERPAGVRARRKDAAQPAAVAEPISAVSKVAGPVPAPGRVVLHGGEEAPPAPASNSKGRQPSEAAIAFMLWVQQGLGDGSLKYNETGALVHFVEAGIALVSPALFRQYAQAFGEPPFKSTSNSGTPGEIGLGIQREVLRAGWHAPNPIDGSNIWTFHVSRRRGGAKASRLSAVVLADVQRWVIEPPPPNLALQMPEADTTADVDK